MINTGTQSNEDCNIYIYTVEMVNTGTQSNADCNIYIYIYTVEMVNKGRNQLRIVIYIYTL